MREVNIDNVTYGKKIVNGKREIDYEKWVDLSELPKWEKGSNKGKIDWQNSVGERIPFRYNEVFDNVCIAEYIKKEKMLNVKYKNENYYMKTTSFTRAKIGWLLNKTIYRFKINIGEHIKDDKRDMTIIDRKYTKDNNNRIRVYYKFKCNKCSYDSSGYYRNREYTDEYWIREEVLLSGCGCACCCNPSQIIVPHINSIVAKEETHWMIPYFQGGYDEAKMYTPSSGKEVLLICPDCGNVMEARVGYVFRKGKMSCICGDGFSYPEKFMYDILKQLSVYFETQYSPNYLILNGSQKRSDFYIPSLNLVIETDGGLGHEGGKVHGRSNKTIQECVFIDRWKDEQHKLNGIKTIRIDCFESDMEYIKNSILNSKFNNLFDLSKIDWLKCNEFALGSLVKDICDYWNNKEECKVTSDLAEEFKLNRTTIIDYLKRGNSDYNPKDEIKRNIIKNNKLRRKAVEVFKDGISLGIYNSVSELEILSEKLFGVRLMVSKISLVANGKRPHHKGFTFKYIEENQNIAS
ncbi:MAG: hypothetical protein ACRDD7_15110 [Peptostreptococcaceae bacterium]